MLKSELIISVMLAAILLLIFFFFNKEAFSIKKEDQSKLSYKEDEVVEENFQEIQEDLEITEENENTTIKLPFKYTSNEFQAGMNILIYGHPDMLEIQMVFERLRNLGINSVAINFPFYQKDLYANELTTSPENTPTLEELKAVIEEAHELGISVMIRPIMDEQVFISSNMWRGEIKPNNPELWFDSYEKLMLSYANLAQSTNVKAINIGTELNSMQNKYQHRWKKLIEKIRQVYNGELLYSFNYDTVNEIQSIEFVKMLDFIGIDAYFPLNVPDNASIPMLEKEWEKKVNQINETLWKERIIVTEVGIIPIVGAYRTPYAWSLPNKYDPQAQVNYYEATFNTWMSRVNGIYWWAVTIGQNPSEISYSPLNLPTENVIKKYFLK